MRVLFVLYYVPPVASVASTRAARMLTGLVQHGIEPVVLTPGSADERSLEAIGEGAIEVIRFPGPDPLAALHRERGTSGRGDTVSSGIKRHLKRLVRSMWLPDERRSLIKPWIAAGRKLRNEPFDAVYSSSSPATTAFVGKALADAFDVPWIMELRDLWAGNPYAHQTSQPLSSWFINRWERRYVTDASKVVVLTRAHAGHLKHKYSGLEEKVHVIPSMFEPLTKSAKVRSMETLRIFYGGTLYADRTLAPLGKAIDGLDPVPPFKSVELEVAGRSYSASWEEALGGTGEGRRIHGWLPLERVQELLHEVHAGVLNNPAHDAIHIPGKFYDYLAAGLPVIDLSSQPDIVSLGEETIPVWQSPGGNPDALREILQDLAAWWERNPQGGVLPDSGHPLSMQSVTKELAQMLRATIRDETPPVSG